MSSIDPDEHEHIPPEAASTYAKIAEAYGGEYYRSVADLAAAHLEPGMRVLDVGTGPGFLPVAIAERVDDVRIDAFDFTRELIEYARDHAEERGVAGRMSFFVADAYRIPTRPESYDVLLSTGVLHSLDEPVRALSEWYRVLGSGGTAWVFDPAILHLPESTDPDEIDVDLTDHEREVLDAYGVRKDEPTPISVPEAERLVASSPFDGAEIGEGEHGDRRLYLARA